MFGYDDLLGLGRKGTGKDTAESFTQIEKRLIFRQQNGKCAICHMKMDLQNTAYYQNTAWCDQGRKKVINARAVCKNCHKVLLHKDKVKNAANGKKQPGTA